MVPKTVKTGRRGLKQRSVGFANCLPSGRPISARASLVERHQRSSQSWSCAAPGRRERSLGRLCGVGLPRVVRRPAKFGPRGLRLVTIHSDVHPSRTSLLYMGEMKSARSFLLLFLFFVLFGKHPITLPLSPSRAEEEPGNHHWKTFIERRLSEGG